MLEGVLSVSRTARKSWSIERLTAVRRTRRYILRCLSNPN